jgi:hypothetical protein
MIDISIILLSPGPTRMRRLRRLCGDLVSFGVTFCYSTSALIFFATFAPRRSHGLLVCDLPHHPRQLRHRQPPQGVATVLADVGYVAHDALHGAGVARPAHPVAGL